MTWVGAFSPPPFPLGSSGMVSSLGPRWSLGRELAPPRTGAATALILCGQQGGEKKKRVRTGRILTDAYRADPAHLDERPVGSDDLDDDHHGDADHGGQGQSPPEGDGPVGILVDLVVGQRLVLDQREDEAALTGGAERQQDTGTFCFKRWSFLPHTAEE